MPAYNVILSDGQRNILIPPRQVSENLASIPLLGRDLAGYGNIIATAQLRMLENFASSTAPTLPLPGQLWYDRTAEEIKVYDEPSGPGSGQWQSVAEPAPELLDELQDVDITNPVAGEFLRFVAGTWQNAEFTAAFTDLSDTPAAGTAPATRMPVNHFLRVDPDGDTIQFVPQIPIEQISGTFSMNQLPLTQLCEWLRDECAPEPVVVPVDPDPDPLPPPDPVPTVSGIHSGGTCSVVVGNTCAATGSLTATISNPQTLVPPFTYEWSRVSGSALDNQSGGPIIKTGINQTTASVTTTMTRTADNTSFFSTYRVRVTDSSSPPKVITQTLNQAEYRFIGLAQPEPDTYNVRVDTAAEPLGNGIGILSGYEAFLGGTVFREAGQRVEIGFQLVDQAWDFDSVTASVALPNQSVTVGQNPNVRILTFDMPADDVEIGFSSTQQAYDLTVNVDPADLFTVAPAPYAPGPSGTRTITVTAGTPVSLTIDNVTNVVGNPVELTFLLTRISQNLPGSAYEVTDVSLADPLATYGQYTGNFVISDFIFVYADPGSLATITSISDLEVEIQVSNGVATGATLLNPGTLPITTDYGPTVTAVYPDFGNIGFGLGQPGFSSAGSIGELPTASVLDSVTGCGGSLSPAVTDPGPWTYSFNMPSNDCTVSIEGSLAPLQIVSLASCNVGGVAQCPGAGCLGRAGVQCNLGGGPTPLGFIDSVLFSPTSSLVVTGGTGNYTYTVSIVNQTITTVGSGSAQITPNTHQLFGNLASMSFSYQPTGSIESPLEVIITGTYSVVVSDGVTTLPPVQTTCTFVERYYCSNIQPN